MKAEHSYAVACTLDPLNKEAHLKASCLLTTKGDYKRSLAFLKHGLAIDEQTKPVLPENDYYSQLICEGLVLL